jgi:hypothetical protein
MGQPIGWIKIFRNGSEHPLIGTKSILIWLLGTLSPVKQPFVEIIMAKS